MKVTQYFTTNGNDFLPQSDFIARPVFQSEPLFGIQSIKREEVAFDSFGGFGVAITGSSCYNLAQMEKSEREKLLKSLYSKDGLGFSVGRVSIGASDYSAQVYSYDDVDGDVALEHFSIEKDKEYIIPILKEIIEINPDIYLYASPWSPPGWMKTTSSMGGGYMRGEYVDCYADYIVKYIQEYAKCGIKIAGLTPQNEIQTDQDGTMPACLWKEEDEKNFVISVKKKLIENKLDVKVWVLDHNFSYVNRVESQLENSNDFKNSCDGIAFHYYGGAIEDTLYLQKSYPDLPMHFTEAGPRLYDNYSTDFCKWAIMMSKVLNCGYKSFTGWNLMLDEYGGPNIGPFFCGGLITRNTQTGELLYSGQYKAFMHVSKFMKKGALIYNVPHESRKMKMFTFPPKGYIPLEVSCIKNIDGSVCYFLTNANDTKIQTQIYENGSWYYVEALPNSVNTVVFEK